MIEIPLELIEKIIKLEKNISYREGRLKMLEELKDGGINLQALEVHEKKEVEKIISAYSETIDEFDRLLGPPDEQVESAKKAAE